VIQRIRFPEVVSDLEAEGVAIEGRKSSRGRKVL
jgi:hypothetical protein